MLRLYVTFVRSLDRKCLHTLLHRNLSEIERRNKPTTISKTSTRLPTMAAPLGSPPRYTQPIDPRRDRLPPYKASHAFANSAEELAALKEFAESKMYVDPGTNGLLPDIT